MGANRIGMGGMTSHTTYYERYGGYPIGIPARVDRLSGLGNAVVPQVVEIIGRAIMEMTA